MSLISIFDIPEIIESIASQLNSDELTRCIRVCKSWYQEFIPYLWRDVSVLDFDFVHWIRNIKQGLEDDSFGRNMASKYSHYIHSIETQFAPTLTYLGSDCVNLERLCLGYFPMLPTSNHEVAFWRHLQREDDIYDDAVPELLERNPGLRVVKLISATGKVAKAFGKLSHLEELWVRGRFDGRILERCSKTLRILRVDLECDNLRYYDPNIAGAIMPADLFLEEITFYSVQNMKMAFEHVASCKNLRVVTLTLYSESEVDDFVHFIQRYGANIQDLYLTSRESFAGLSRVISAIPKLRSLVVKQSPLHVLAIQAIVIHHKESIEIFENIQECFRCWDATIVDSRAKVEQLEAMMSLWSQCARLRVFSSLLISVTVEQLLESEWAAMTNITALKLAVNGYAGLEEDERNGRTDKLIYWLDNFKKLQSSDTITDWAA
ncbi:hypothetical protein BGX27_000882 [Mortierella sp. AM989]|nr:hypothetical protein BGX27_000882 [Mortierella sp. AM989]